MLHVPVRDETSQSSITAVAYEHFSEYADEAHELVYRIAEEIARRRQEGTSAGAGEVLIDVEDVREAWGRLAAALKGYARSYDVLARLAPSLEAFDSRIREHDAS